MTLRITINRKLISLPIVMLLVFVAGSALLLQSMRTSQEVANQDKVRAVVEVAMGVVRYFEDRSAKGEMSVEDAQTKARDVIRTMRYGSRSDYFFITSPDNKLLVHGVQPQLEGRDFGGVRDVNGVPYARMLGEAARAGGGHVYFSWQRNADEAPLLKVAYAAMSPGWKWVVGSGVFVDHIEADFRAHALEAALIAAMLGGIAALMALLIARSITKPLTRLTQVMRRLADGDVDVAVTDSGRRDEIGEMAAAMSVFKDRAAENHTLRLQQEEMRVKAQADRAALLASLADSFERSIGEVVRLVTASAGTMRVTARTLTDSAGVATDRSSAAFQAADSAKASIGSVAAAAEELTSSISEIGRQAGVSSEIAHRAVDEATKTNQIMDGLVRAANEVGEVVSLINSIAGQTNLLALNATIEAARAGEHGKGFAVVASEVKGLAGQTARATEDIQRKISEIQQATDAAVVAIRDIGGIIGQMTGIASTIAAAVEEQGAATSEISRNVHNAAEGAQAVSLNVAGANDASVDAGGKAEAMLGEADRLVGVAEKLRGEVEGFVANIRAA